MTRPPRRRILAALLLPLLACGREPGATRPPLRPPADRDSARTIVDSDGIARAGTLVPVGGFYEWKLPEAAGGRFRFAWSSPEIRGDVALEVEILQGADAARTVARLGRSFPEAPAPAVFWSEDVEISAGVPGRRLRLSAAPAAAFFLSDLRLAHPSPSSQAVLLTLFDTTRLDAVGFGGCRVPSTPNLDAILRNAWKAERAYAPASWTIPSVASLLTGRVPAAHEDADGSPLGIVPGIPTLAEDFRRAGWSTAAFLANPTLTAGNGFARGFETFFTTPHEGASITLPGRETMRRVPAWLAAHRGEPFFLLVFLMDPHDPYTPFDRPRGSTPFDPGYRGAYVGDEVNRLQLGEPPPPSAADVRHLEALYHDEVRLADAAVGSLWRGTPVPERNRWTLAFSSDHGEEFGEHGGWKHGPALYDEVLRVPLAILPARGRRLPAIPPGALVSLLDVLPTLEELAGLPPPRRPLDGASLLDPSTWDREALPPVTMLTGGPARAAVVRGSSKLFFFDRLGTRSIPDPTKDPRGYHLARRLPGILAGLAQFDLAEDPRERRPLPVDRKTFGEDWRAIEEAIAHTRRGTELRLVGADSLEVEVQGLTAKAVIEPFALEENDRFTRSRSTGGQALTARLDPSDGVDGFRFEDAPGPDLQITVGGGGCVELRLAGARPARLSPGSPQKVPFAAIPGAIPFFETGSGCTGVFLWTAEGRQRARTAAEGEEAWRKLRALGYLH
ncbi:MAG: sulfatase-like hydrolase/transferase [Thermoanaerobaculia bacterium]